MGQQLSLAAEGQESTAGHMAENSDPITLRNQSQRDSHQGQSQSYASGLSEQNSNLVSPRQLGPRKNGVMKESPPSAVPVVSTSSSLVSATPMTSACRTSRHEADLGRMSVREAIDSFIESRLSATNDSPPPPPVSKNFSVKGLKPDDSRSSSKPGEDSTDIPGSDRINSVESRDLSLSASMSASDDSNRKDTAQVGADSKESGASSNEAVDEESERMSDRLVIDCDATESPQSATGRSESMPPSKEREGSSVTPKTVVDNMSPINLSETKDVKDKDSDKSSGDDEKKRSPSAKEEKKSFSSYLQDRLKAQLASHVDTEAQGHLYLWDVNKSNATSNTPPVTSTITRTGSVRLQTLIDKVLDQSIGKGLSVSPSESDSSHLFLPVKPSSESSSSPSDNSKSMEKSPSSHPCPGKTQNSLMKFGMNPMCFKDHIEKVVVENFLSYEEEEGEGVKSDTRQKREESAASSSHNSTSMPNSDLDSGKDKREMGGVGPDGTISVQHIVDRVISQTEVISKLLTPGAADQTSERMSPGRSSSGRAVNSSSPSSVPSAPSRSIPGGHASSEGPPTGGGSGQPSIGRKRGRPRLSSPVSRPNTWSSDRNPGSAGDRGNIVFRDPQSGDYRATSSALLHGRQGGPSKPHHRMAQGQGPPPIDMIASQGSIQHGLPIGALVPQQPPSHMYHSQLHPHHPQAQQHPSSENPNSSARPILTSSLPPPHSPHLTSYHQRGLHHPGPHPHGPQPPSPHSHPQHHHRPPDHLASHHSPHNKPLPPLIHANHIQDRHVVTNNSTSIASGSCVGSRVSSSGGVGSSRLVPVSHIPTASCSCPNCVAIYSRDKPPQVPPSSSHHQQHIRRGEAGIPSHIQSSKLPDARREDPRSHPLHPQPPYAVYDNATALASRGEHLTAQAPETLNPVVAVGSKVVPPSAVIPSFIAARRPLGIPLALDPHSREEQHYPRDDKSAHYPYSPQGKPTSSDTGYPEDERYRAWQRAQTSDQHSSHPTLPYAPYEQARKASAHGHVRQSPEKEPQQHQPQPLDLQKSGYTHPEAPLASGSSPANADQPLDLSVKPSAASDHKNRDQDVTRPPPTLRNEAFYQDPAVGQRYASSHGPHRETDPRDAYTDVDGAGRGPPGRPETAADRPPQPIHAYPPGHRAFAGPPSSHPLVAQYPPQAGPKAPHLHPAQVYLPRGDSRGNAQVPSSERPTYPNSGHLLSPSNTATNSRESPTLRSRHPYTPYPLPPSSSSSSSSPSPSLQLQLQPPQQSQPQHPAASQPPSLSIPPHLRGTAGASPGGNTQYQRRSPYSDLVRQPKHQDPRAPSPHYSSVGSHQKTPDSHNYPGLAGSQDAAEIRGVHTNLPPPHPQPGVSPDDQDSLKHCVSKHEPIQNIIGNHPQNDILYLICKLCRQTYGSPYGFRKHFRNQHGFEPKVEHTIVQTISATKTAMAHTGPTDQPVTDVDKKGALYSDSQGPQTGDVPVSFKSEYSPSPLVIDKHTQDMAASHGKALDDLKKEPKAESKPLDGKLEAGSKFLECPECGQTFQLNDFGSYKRHCRQHSVNQYSGPFSCHDCQKSFAEPGQLQQHLNTHKSFTPSLCGFCPTFFSSPHYLAVHLQAAHGHVVSSESLKKSSDGAELKSEVKNEKHNTIDLHTMIENALMEINVPHNPQQASNTDTKTSLSSAHNVASSSSHHEHASAVSSSISSLPLSKRHKMSIASSNSPVLTTVHTPKKLEVQKLPADAVVTTASPDSSYEEGKGQASEPQLRLSTSALKSGYSDLVPSPSNCSNNSQGQREAKESCDSQDSNHSNSFTPGSLKRDENGSRTGQIDIAMSVDKIGSNKDDSESITSDRCQSVDSNSQSVGESRASSPGCDDAEKFYKHKKYSRHRKRMSSSDAPSEIESKTPKLSTSSTSYDNDQTSATSVSSTNNANTVVQVCESSSGHYDGKFSASATESSGSSLEDTGSSKMASKGGKFEKAAKESRQEDSSIYGGKCSSDGSKKVEGGDGITKYKWDRLTRSQTGKSPQAVSYSNT